MEICFCKSNGNDDNAKNNNDKQTYYPNNLLKWLMRYLTLITNNEGDKYEPMY